MKKLNLLFPEELPVQSELNELDKSKLLSSLRLALESLDASSQKLAISKLDRALEILDPPEIFSEELYDLKKKIRRRHWSMITTSILAA